MKDKYTESLYKQDYSDWISDQKLPSHDGYYLTGEDLEFVYDAQQSKINELLERLRECEESLGFYAEEGNWNWEHGDSNKTQDIIEDIDVEYCNIFRDGVGGKLARAYFKKYEGK